MKNLKDKLSKFISPNSKQLSEISIKSKFFNASLMLEGIKQTLGLGICALLITLIFSCGEPILAILQLQKYHRSEVNLLNFSISTFIIWVIVPIVMVTYLFRFMNKRSASDFYHSIPLNRTCVYVSYSMSVIFWEISSIVSSTIISYILYQIAPEYYITSSDIAAQTILACLIASFLSTSITLLAKGLSGTEFSNIVITVLIMFIPRILITSLCEAVIRSIAYIAPTSSMSFANPTLNILLVPIYPVQSYKTFAEILINPSTIIYSVILAVVYYILGLLAHKHRKSESAGKSSAYSGVQIVVRSVLGFIPLFTVCCQFIVEGYEIFNYFGGTTYVVVMSVISIFLYFLYELVTTKNGKKLLKAIPMYIIVILLCLLFTGSGILLRNAIIDDVPELSEIESVSFPSMAIGYGNGYYNSFSSQDYEFKDKDLIALFQNALVDNISHIKSSLSPCSSNYKTYTVIFHTTSGKDIERMVYVEDIPENDITPYFIKETDFIENITALPPRETVEYVYFSNYEPQDIDNAVLNDALDMYWEEYQTLTYEQKFKVFTHNFESDEVNGYFEVSGEIDHQEYELELLLFTDLFPKTSEIIYKNQN